MSAPALPPPDAPRLTVPAPTRRWAHRVWLLLDSTGLTLAALAALLIVATLIGAGPR